MLTGGRRRRGEALARGRLINSVRTDRGDRGAEIAFMLLQVFGGASHTHTQTFIPTLQMGEDRGAPVAILNVYI